MHPVRDQILQTTISLLEKQGYHATGLNEIVKESGTPKGSLYYYFPEGKDQITAEAVLQSGRATAEHIRNGLAGQGNPAQTIHDFILLVAENVERSGFSAGSPLTAVAMETSTSNERINLACRAAYGMIEGAFMERFLSNGMEQVRAQNLATFITSSIEGGIILSRTYHTADPLRQVAQALQAIFQPK